MTKTTSKEDTPRIIVIDSETDGWEYECKKIHILSYTEDGKKVVHLKDHDDMRELLSSEDAIFVCHNAIMFDMVVFHRILGIPMDYKRWVDSLAVSWFLEPDRQKHGLGSYQEASGVVKPNVEDWENVTWEQMCERCGNDVLINWWLWTQQKKRLTEIYGSFGKEVLRFLRYLSFKMDCLREQKADPLTLDVEKAQRHFDELDVVIEEKLEALAEVMPRVPDKKKKKPSILKKQDGTYTKLGQEWFDTLKELKLPSTTEGEVVVTYKKGNPKSNNQIKEWLTSLGWEPCEFKFSRNKITGETKSIPQVRYHNNTDPRKGQLTESVLRLKEREPKLELLEGLTVAQHRRSIFEGFLKAQKDGRIVSGAGGFTNTLRLKHRAPICNLPGVDSPWGKEIRGCIVAPEGQVVIGSDVSSLESSTKRHYMWAYDPKYVKEMSEPGFDEHLDLAKHSGVITPQELEDYKDGKRPDLKGVRSQYKVTNYSAVYGVQPPSLSRSLGCTIGEAEKLLDAYWKRNWSVRKLSSDQYVKRLKDRSAWLKNPVSGFYYSLRSEKDIFSTLNQGTGVFIVDTWIMRMRKDGVHPQMQYHDEVLLSSSNPDLDGGKIEEAMSKVNETLKLNVDIGVDVQYGDSYASVH